MPAKNTKTIKTLESQSGSSIGVFFPDLSTIQRLSLVAAENTQFPPTADGAAAPEGGVWYLYVPAGKSVLLIDGPMSNGESEDIDLVLARAWPIQGPIYYPVAFEDGDYGYIVPDGVGFDVHVCRGKNNGGAA